jgi:sporulation protein YlmC with PRC-barrel domain
MAEYSTGTTGGTQTEHVRETHDMISAEKVIGTTVYNASGDDLGTIHDLMLDKRGGRVAYAVMSFGGFLGIGEKYHPLPWHVLTYDEDKGGYNVDLTEEQLRGAPAYTESELEQWGRTSGEPDRVGAYYGSLGYPPTV